MKIVPGDLFCYGLVKIEKYFIISVDVDDVFYVLLFEDSIEIQSFKKIALSSWLEKYYTKLYP